jgi:cell division protein FtsQ
VVTTAFERRRREEARRTARRRLKIGGLALAPVLLVAGAVWSPLLDVDTVRVVGNKRIATAVIRNVSRVRTGTPLATVDTGAVRRRVGGIAAVKSVTVRRSWPATLTIRVVERVPVVAVHRPGRYDLYDIDGVTVETVTTLPPGTPTLTVPGEPTRDVVAATVALLRALPPALRQDVRDLRGDASGSLSFALADGAVVLWGGPDRTAEKVHALVLLAPQHAKRYDLRVPDRPAVTPR